MHDQHDDPLERELSQLSNYTGGPTSIWQDAVDKHRRQQHQQLWVWVRRPAPAVAAAALALLVTVIALQQPAAPRHAERSAGRALDDVSTKWTDESGVRPMVISPTPSTPLDASGNNDLSRSSGLNGGNVDQYSGNARLNDQQNERYARTQGNQLPGESGGNTTPPAAGNTGSDVKLAVRDLGHTSRSGANPAPGTAGGRGGRGDHIDPKMGAATPATRSPDTPAPAGDLALNKERPAPATAPAAPALDPLEDKLLATKREESEKNPAEPAAKGMEGATAASEPLQVTANIRVAVADTNTFYYKLIPSLVDTKNGERISNAQLVGVGGKDAQDAAAGFNLTLHVNEQNLPAVMEQLRKTGSVQTESLQFPPKEARLKQVDALLVEKERELKSASPAAAGDKAKTAVPMETKDTKRTAAKSGSPATPASPAAPALPSVPGDETALKKTEESIRALNRQRDRIEKGVDFATLNIQAVPELQPPPAAPMKPEGIAEPLAGAPVVPPAANFGAQRADSTDRRDQLAAKTDADKLGPIGNTPAVAGSTKEYNATSTLSDHSAAPAPQSAAAPARDSGKITRAAKEGWSSLGDTTADFVRNAIGTMLYWLPALIAAIAALWWVRRRAAESMREPPPQ